MQSIYQEPFLIKLKSILEIIRGRNLQNEDNKIIYNSINKAYNDEEIMYGIVIIYKNYKVIKYITNIFFKFLLSLNN